MDRVIEKKVKEILFFHKVIYYFLIGILWALAQVTYSFSLLTWFALVPFLFTIKYEYKRNGVIYSFIFGTTAYLFSLWWLPSTIAKVGLSIFTDKIFTFPVWSLSFLIYLIVAFYHGFVFVVIYYVTKFLTRGNYYLFYLIFPVVATLCDYFYPKIFSDQIGYSQYVFFHFSQVADIFGVPFITLLVLYSNSAVILLIETIIYKKQIKRTVIFAFLVLLAIIISSIYGVVRYNSIMIASENAKKAKIAIVQGNFTGLDKFDSKKYNTMIDKYNELTKTLLTNKPSVVIWPETAIPFIRNIQSENYDMIKKFNFPLIAGIILQDESVANKRRYYNSAVLISTGNKLIDYYLKMKLFPFSEKYLPSFLLKNEGFINFSNGKENKIFTIEDIKVAPTICYELLFADFVRKASFVNNQKANLFVNITNDSWFGRNFMPDAHLHIAGFRAIENRKALVRVASTGYSAYFNPAGDIIYRSTLFDEDASVVTVPLMEEETFFQKGGWLFIWILLVFFIIISAVALIRTGSFKMQKRELINKAVHSHNLKKIWRE